MGPHASCTSCIRRQEEGTADAGYTLSEACVLARSSMGSQRAAALHILAAVLAQVIWSHISWSAGDLKLRFHGN